MANLDDLAALLENNLALDGDEEDNEAFSFQNLKTELQANPDGAIQILNTFTVQLGLHVGEYGSLNIGARGARYRFVRNFILAQRHHAEQHPDFPMLRFFLTEPVANLHAYDHSAGPGGQGPMKIALNNCWGATKDRVSRVIGMLLSITLV